MKVIVTGGAGFIGSHIVDLLLENNYKVVVIDDFSSGDNISKQVIYYKRSILSKEVVDIFQKEKPDILIHQAAQVSVAASQKDPINDMSNNVLGTLSLMEAARQTGVKKVIFSSSSAVYGEPQYLPINEVHPIKPISIYGNSKWFCEELIQLYNRLYRIDFTILRYANVYGPKQKLKDGNEGGVVPIFIDMLLKGMAPTIFGDGSQTRDFIYVKDVAKANLLSIKKGSSQILNIGSGHKISILSLYKQLQQVTSSLQLPHYGTTRIGEIKDSVLNIERAKRELTWEPQYSLQKGLKETISSWI